MRKFSLFIFFGILVWSCNNIDTEDPSPINSFIRFYEGPYSMQAQSVETIPGGFVVLATMTSGTVSNPIVQTILIETNEKGVRQRQEIYNDISGKSFKPIIKNGAVDQYIIVGSKVVINQSAAQVANVSISSMEILIVNSSLNEVVRKSLSDKKAISESHPVIDDYFGASVTIGKDGEVVLLGTFKKGTIDQQNAPEEQLLFGLTSNLDSAWVKFYPLLGNTFINSRSIHTYNKNIVWATAVAEVQGDITSSYVAIPFVPEKKFPSNYSMIGETTEQLYIPKDIQPFSSPEFGYGVTGTYSDNKDGTKGNIFFFKVDAYGNILHSSEKFFDGIAEVTDKNSSSVVDSGEALIGTRDGGFALAGTLTNTNTQDKDISLIKVNAFGERQWSKIMGAAGDQEPVAIRETESGDLLICGTHTLENYSTVFLVRTDRNGELKN
jgi:hypothetical protein